MKPARKWQILNWLGIAVCAVVVLVAGISTRSMSIAKRGIVIGVGIDRTDEGYRVCAQMMQPGQDSAPTSPVQYEVVVGEGPTVYAAMADIMRKTSMYPSYVHCKVLFLGYDMLDEALDDVMIGLMRRNELGNVQVVAVEGTAYHAITATVAILPTSSAFIERDNLLVSKSGGRRLVSLKDYCQRIDGHSGNKFLPLAVEVEAEPPTGGDAPKDGSPVLYDMMNTLAFDVHNRPHAYGNAVTEGVGLIEAKGGQYTAYREDGRYVTVRIRNTRIRRRYHGNTVEGVYRYEVSVLEQTLSEDEPKAAAVEELVARCMDRTMQTTYETCLRDEVDIYSVAGHLYKRFGREVSQSDMRWQHTVEVKCK